MVQLNNNAACDTPDTITVYLAYASSASSQHYQTLQVKQGTTLYSALSQAGWLTTYPSLAAWCEQVADQAPSAKRWHVGIYAKKQPLYYELQDRDRIEVYRSLSADPMIKRKQKTRAKQSLQPR